MTEDGVFSKRTFRMERHGRNGRVVVISVMPATDGVGGTGRYEIEREVRQGGMATVISRTTSDTTGNSDFALGERRDDVRSG